MIRFAMSDVANDGNDSKHVFLGITTNTFYLQLVYADIGCRNRCTGFEGLTIQRYRCIIECGSNDFLIGCTVGYATQIVCNREYDFFKVAIFTADFQHVITNLGDCCS